MNPADLTLFLFDLAGTTIVDDGRVLRAFRDIATREGLAVEDDWLLTRMGWFKGRVFSELLVDAGRDPTEASALTQRFDAVMAEDYRMNPPRPLAGAVEAFSELRAEGVMIGFTTGFTRAVAELILSSRPFGQSFRPDVLVASDEVASGRPAPDLIHEGMHRLDIIDARTVGVAGDTPSDLEAGSAAGCRVVVGVGHGTHTLDELSRAPHTALLPDLAGLMDAIHRTP